MCRYRTRPLALAGAFALGLAVGGLAYLHESLTDKKGEPPPCVCKPCECDDCKQAVAECQKELRMVRSVKRIFDEIERQYCEKAKQEQRKRQ